jgi:RTX calcium-binding nonapeptide repeat (4 copies)
MTDYFGTSNADSILGSLSADNIFGYDGNDTLDGNTGNNGDVIYGGANNDRIFLRTSSSPFSAGATAFGGNDNDTVSGSIYKDLIYGDLGADSLLGSGGDDTIAGTNQGGSTSDSGDAIRGDADNDLLYGNSGNDDVRGGSGNDTVFGGQNEDNVVGDAGNDRLYGDLGNDNLRGLIGNDTMTGGGGLDTFHITPLQNADEIDVITDFEGDLTTNIIDSLNIPPQSGVTLEAYASGSNMRVRAITSTQQTDFLVVIGRSDLVSAFNSAFRVSNSTELDLSENATDALAAGLAPSPEGAPNPLDVMQEALEALRAGKPIPESNPLAKSGLSIQALETQIDEILAASEGREILNNSVSGNIPVGEIDPLTGSTAPSELPELKVYTPEQQAEIDKILNGEGRGFFFDGEDNVYIEKGWSITVPDYEGRESISYGGLILTNPEFSQDAYYIATEDLANVPTFEEWKAQQLI